MKCTFLLYVVVPERTSIFQLLSRENKTLLVRGDAFLVLYLLLDDVYSIAGLTFHCDGFACKCFDEYLHLYFVLSLIWNMNRSRAKAH